MQVAGWDRCIGNDMEGVVTIIGKVPANCFINF